MKRASWAIAVALGVGIVWLVGLVALGIWNEDVCITDTDAVPLASGSTQTVRVWPPALVCQYFGTNTTEDVAHPIRGFAIVGWTYVVPLLTVAGLVVWASHSPPSPSPDRLGPAGGA